MMTESEMKLSLQYSMMTFSVGHSWTTNNLELAPSLRHCVTSDTGAKYHFVSRVRPLFLHRHHGSHARSRVSALCLFFSYNELSVVGFGRLM